MADQSNQPEAINSEAVQEMHNTIQAMQIAVQNFNDHMLVTRRMQLLHREEFPEGPSLDKAMFLATCVQNSW